MEQSRWKSPVAWSSIAALIIFISKTWFGYEIPGWNEFITLLITALTAFGIFNNPEKKDTF